MKNCYLIVLFYLFSLFSFSQKKFELGKIEFTNGTVLECYIKTIYESNNPENVFYKLDSNTESESIVNLNQINSYEIFGKVKYIKASVDFDKSNVKEPYSNTKEPEFKKVDALLEVLIDSKADLLKLTIDNITRYYYRLDEGEIKPLIYKKFTTKTTSGVGYNSSFISEINSNMQCEGIMATNTNLSYNKSSLMKYFNLYNKCVDSDIIFQTSKQKIIPKIYAKLGYGMNTYKISTPIRDLNGRNIDHKHTQNNFYGGVIGEFNLPFSNRNFSLITGLDYIDYSTDFSTNPNRGNYYSDISISAKNLRIPIGVRYNIYLTDSYETNIIYIEGMLDFILPIGDQKISENSKNTISTSTTLSNTYEIKYNPNLALAVGFPIYKKLGGALVYNFNQDFLKNVASVSVKSQAISFQLNYQVF